jgi:hypothetical protein
MTEKQIPFSIATNAREFLAGIAAEEAAQRKVKEDAVKQINSFVTTIDSDLRTSYDRLIPNVHVVDVVSFTNIIANRLTSNPERFLDAGSDLAIISRFADSTSKEYQGLYKVILESVSKYHSEILAKQRVPNPIQYLNDLSAELFRRTRKIDNTISARILGAEFGSKIRAVFGRAATLAAVDPRLGSSDTVFVFFSNSFKSIGDPMRLRVYEPIKVYIKDTLGTDTVSKLDIGATVNIGHAALVNDIGAYVNSPALAATLYGVASGRSNLGTNFNIKEVAATFKIESKITENSITVTKDLTSSSGGFGVLLALGVTFTNVEDADTNRLRGSKSEKNAISKYKIKKAEPLSRSGIKALTESIYKVVLKKNPQLGRSSRSILEFIEDGFRATLVGKQTKSEKTRTKVTSKVVKTTVTRNTDKKQDVFKNPNIAKKTTNLVRRKVVPNVDSLAPLQALLDASLYLQIKKNMGKGTATNVLNFRTGRLAASAKVERLSRSREGMITAFYSYMRNPYATFSEGGLQQSPKTRDPKTLISKSIRELGATMAYNRMRAVLV